MVSSLPNIFSFILFITPIKIFFVCFVIKHTALPIPLPIPLPWARHLKVCFRSLPWGTKLKPRLFSLFFLSFFNSKHSNFFFVSFCCPKLAATSQVKFVSLNLSRVHRPVKMSISRRKTFDGSNQYEGGREGRHFDVFDSHTLESTAFRNFSLLHPNLLPGREEHGKHSLSMRRVGEKVCARCASI